jgi:hypothetical protein
MRIYVSDPNLVEHLLDFLHIRLDCVRERMNEHEVRISPLGSLGERRAQLAVDLELRAWEATCPGARARWLEEI